MGAKTPRDRKTDGRKPREPGGEAVQARGQDTRLGLLEAAERIILEEGIQALTVRRVGAVSGLNPTLVTYHFGTMANLLGELCRKNLEPMLADWEPLTGQANDFATIRAVLAAWLGPLLRPAAFTPNGRALVVLDEIAAHGDEEMSRQLLRPMLDISGRVQSALQPYVGHLAPRELRARLRLISGATLGPPPRARIVAVDPGEQPLDGIDYLLNFAEAALSAH